MNPNLLTGPAATAEVTDVLKSGTSGYYKRMASEAHRIRVHSAGILFGKAWHGDQHAQADLQEALSTSDFPILFGDFLNRTLAARYAVAAPVWNKFAARTTVRDFRPAKIIDFMGGGSVLDKVPQLDEYPARSFSESEFALGLAKYGDRLQWSWEMGINDDLGAFQRAPGALSRGAAATEDFVATSVLCNAAGPLAWLGTPDTVPLTMANLEAATQKITDVVDEDGNPIDIGTPILVVPQALVLTAQNIVSTTEVRSVTGTTTTIVSGNNLSATPKIVPNRWLTGINKAAKAKATWYLLPDPNGPRPAVYEVFLQGHETPDLRVKADAGMMLGGGNVDPSQGSFERDSVEYRIRHVVGGSQGFDDAVYVSLGS